MSVRHCALVCALCAGIASGSVIHLDPAKSNIEFTLADVLHTVHGSFRLKSGVVNFDVENKAISGLIVVDAASGNSGSSLRDGRMKRTYLEVQRYPEITFAPTRFEGTPDPSGAAMTVMGRFTLHGENHALSIPMHIKISGSEVSATGDFSVPYVAWGIKNPSTLFLRVNEKVQIHVSVTGSIE